MIIECPNCNKKFNLDEKLIPKNGRSLKCSSCKHIWYYKFTTNTDQKNLKLSENRNSKVKTEVSEIEKENKKIITDTDNQDKKNEIISKKKVVLKEIENKEKKLKNKSDKNIKLIFFYFIILIISLLGLILLLDTFKLNLSNIYPDIIPLFNSFYETLLDLKLFFIDLTN